MPFTVVSRRTGSKRLAQIVSEVSNLGGPALIVDGTSKGAEPWVKFSPFFPHGNIPVPFSRGFTSQSVEGIWQGLKVFEHEDVDPSRLAITNMVGIKRSVRTRGAVKGHRNGLGGERLLSYSEARQQIYLPTYRWVLENKLESLLGRLQKYGAGGTVVLLDYETNQDINNLSKPLSHAGLVRAYLEGTWPSMSV